MVTVGTSCTTAHLKWSVLKLTRSYERQDFNNSRLRLDGCNYWKYTLFIHNMSYELGQKITVGFQLKRVSRFVQDGDAPWKQEWKYWEERKLRAPLDGIVIGIRNLSNGKNHYLGSEEGMSYEPKEHFKAIIVAYQLSRKPILVKI